MADKQQASTEAPPVEEAPPAVQDDDVDEGAEDEGDDGSGSDSEAPSQGRSTVVVQQRIIRGGQVVHTVGDEIDADYAANLGVGADGTDTGSTADTTTSA